MSMVRCDECDRFIDSDDDPDCFGAFGKGEVTLCEWCREVSLKREVVPINYDDVLSAVREAMDHEPTPEKQPLEQRIDQLYRECEDLFILAANQETVGQFKGEWRQIDQAATRLQWVATAVEASIPSKLKVVSR